MGASSSSSGAADPFCSLTDLASTAAGARVLFATDEWFAPAQMMLSPKPPVFQEGVFTEFGKWMDGWETRRKRIAGHDWCIIELAVPGVIRGFEIDTAFFTGNNVPAISVLGLKLPSGLPEELVDRDTGVAPGTGTMGTAATPEQVLAVEQALAGVPAVELLPRSALRPGYPETRVHYFEAIGAAEPVTHLRVNYFPDGGVARFHAFGEVAGAAGTSKQKLLLAPEEDGCCDFAYALRGGVALCWSNAHYGSPANTLLPGRAVDMSSGWETARNPARPAVLELGSDGLVDFSYSQDWFVLKLAARCRLRRVTVDTLHFRGNYPESIFIEVCDRPDLLALRLLKQKSLFEDAEFRGNLIWRPLLQRTRLAAHEARTFDCVTTAGEATHARISIFPDGGISRLRLYGVGANTENEVGAN